YGDPAGEAYFMVTNGLGGDLQDASALATDCAQSMTLNFNFGASGITALDRLRRSDGAVEVLPLNHISGSLYSYTLTLDGGTGDLFKYDDGTAFVGTSFQGNSTRYWDNDGSVTGNSISTGANLGGTGTWDTTALKWYNGSAEVAWRASK